MVEVGGSLRLGSSRGGGRVERGPLRGLVRGAASLVTELEVEEAQRWEGCFDGEERWGRSWDLNAIEVAL